MDAQGNVVPIVPTSTESTTRMPPRIAGKTPPAAASQDVTPATPSDALDDPRGRAEWLVSGLASCLVHVALTVILALLYGTPEPRAARTHSITLDLNPAPVDAVELNADSIPDKRPVAAMDLAVGLPRADEIQFAAPIEIPGPIGEAPTISDVPLPDVAPQVAGGGAAKGNAPFIAGLSGPERSRRRDNAMTIGQTPTGEAAVERGLAWLAHHQRRDGSWRFNHRDGACDGTCENPGDHGATTASTAMALLCFYGAAYTHTEGRYADVINNGLYYLGGRMLLTQQGGDLQEGSMYAQGIATIALCEAAAMTDDPTLRGYAERAIKFILYAQDLRGGGWRYLPGEPGDLTVTGWQAMALKSGQMAGIGIPSPAFDGISRFLDSVQSDHGASYGYRSPERRDSTTAVGLLTRMYLGWTRETPALRAGVKALEKLGPSRTNMYHNYYASQVMLHYGGDPWERWHPKMREYLIATQARDGHAAGSWYFPDSHADHGGRLFNTCLAIMTLEVYYRHAPLYQKKVTDSGF